MSQSWAGGSTRRWRRMRAFILDRDGHVCQVPKGGGVCGAHATHVDHVVPLADGGDKWDPANLRAACAPCNLSRGTAARAAGPTVDVTVLIGPPGAGKTTHAARHAAPDDIVIDLDAIANALWNGPDGGRHDYPKHVRHVAIGARAAAIRRAVALAAGACHVWIIHAIPNVAQVRAYVADGWQVQAIDPGPEALATRLDEGGRGLRHRDAAETWYARREDLLAAIDPPEDWTW